MSYKKNIEMIASAFYDAFKHGDSARLNIAQAQTFANHANEFDKFQPIKVVLSSKRGIEQNGGRKFVLYHDSDNRLGGSIPRNYRASINRIFDNLAYSSQVKGFHV